jgi:hypothetical protein
LGGKEKVKKNAKGVGILTPISYIHVTQLDKKKMEIKLKKCSHCGNEKVTTEFYPTASVCKPCKSAKANEWRLANNDKFKALPSRSIEKGREYSRKAYAKKKEQLSGNPQG